jgi:hypothetical protein
MRIARGLAVWMIAGAGALGIISVPATALATPAPAPRVLMPSNCKPEVFPDYAHLSATPGDVSAHAYWKRGTCTKAQVGMVLVFLEEKLNGEWVQVGHEGINNRMLPGKLPVGKRPNARGHCDSKEETWWRSVGIVRVAANGENGDDHKITPEKHFACHIN